MQQPRMLSAKEIANEVVEVGKYKVSRKNSVVVISGMLAGLFIALGYTIYLLMYGQMSDPFVGKIVGAFLFPVALILILLTGADLFTGNTLIGKAYFKKEVKLSAFIKNLALVWVGNLLGVLLGVALLTGAHLFTTGVSEQVAENIRHLAEVKVNTLTTSEVFFRGILCNILIAGGVYVAYCAKDVTGKCILNIVIVAVFALMGVEHCVANMFVLSMAKVLGAHITFGGIAWNIFIATIANIVGGFVIVIPYYYNFIHAYNKKNH
ncbi:MAG: formate/nitrite transporter family protein [Turicibacter sp.]|nr:formate/nitrite transporter family protein [Turicibacter sp.]